MRLSKGIGLEVMSVGHELLQLYLTPDTRPLPELKNKARSAHLLPKNVDGLHQEAGSKAVIDLHGRLDQRDILIQEISLKPAR